MTSTLKSASLGEIRGKVEDGVIQYLGIKYGALKNRLADAELAESSGRGVLDATKDGPTSVSPLFGFDMELGAIQHTIPKKELQQSDVDCLNLNISVPSGTTPSSKLPVFLFIHGGGYIIGANSWPQYDHGRLVRFSAEKNLPIVVVSINYRLCSAGFLTSDELRKAGYKANNGLRDQKVAFEWVRKHIQEFGGDPDNLNVAGESAGAASVAYHLRSETPLFNRAILMSGSFLIPPPLPYEAHEENYRKAMAVLGLENATAEERIRVLLETPGQELISRFPPFILSMPAVDGDIIPSSVTFAQTADENSDVPRGDTWCKDVFVGDTQMDANVLGLLMPHTKQNCAKKFTDTIHSVLSSKTTVAQHILDEYGITPDLPDEEAFPAVLDFINDIVFFAPTLTLAEGWRGNAYVYYFNEGNPWDGPWKGRATHILDVAYLFQNFREFLTPAQQDVAAGFAEDLFKFCHGVAPWPTILPGQGKMNTGFTARTYGPSTQDQIIGEVTEPFSEKSLRRSTLFNCAEQVSLDDLAMIFGVFSS